VQVEDLPQEQKQDIERKIKVEGDLPGDKEPKQIIEDISKAAGKQEGKDEGKEGVIKGSWVEEYIKVFKKYASRFLEIFASEPEKEQVHRRSGRRVDLRAWMRNSSRPFLGQISEGSLPELAFGITVDVSGSITCDPHLPHSFTEMVKFFLSLMFNASLQSPEGVCYSLSAIGEGFHKGLLFSNRHSQEELKEFVSDDVAWMMQFNDSGGINTINLINGLREKWQDSNIPKSNRIEIVFTDGEETSGQGEEHFKKLRRMVEDFEQESGVKVIFVGVGTEEVRNYSRYLVLSQNPSPEDFIQIISKIGERITRKGTLPKGDLADALGIQVEKDQNNNQQEVGSAAKAIQSPPVASSGSLETIPNNNLVNQPSKVLSQTTQEYSSRVEELIGVMHAVRDYLFSQKNNPQFCLGVAVELGSRLGEGAQVYTLTDDASRVSDLVHFWVVTPDFILDAFPEGLGKYGKGVERYMREGVVIVPRNASDIPAIYRNGVSVKETIWNPALKAKEQDLEQMRRGEQFPSRADVLPSPFGSNTPSSAVSQPNAAVFKFGSTSPSPSPTPQAPKNLGGIDFRSLPIVTQAISNLSSSINQSNLNRLNNLNLAEEWSQIERLVSSGIIPSSERIKEYIQASCAKGRIEEDLDKIICCISDILRQEEERCCLTEPTLRDILVVLEASQSDLELSKVFLGKLI